jgi:hypothetical protein
MLWPVIETRDESREGKDEKRWEGSSLLEGCQCDVAEN